MNILLTALIFLGALSAGLADAGDLPKVDDKLLAREANAALAQKDYKTAFTKFSALAEQGIPAAQFNLGAFYLNGQGVQKDDKLAFEWFRKSALQGNDRALKFIESAAAQGNVHAMNELRVIKGPTEPVRVAIQPQEKPQVKPVEKNQEIPQFRTGNEKDQEKPQVRSGNDKVQEKPRVRNNNKAKQDKLVNYDPTVAAAGNWVFGISAEYSKYKSTEPLYYPSGGVLNSTAQGYSVSQPGVSVWFGQDDITVTASFRKRSGTVASVVPTVGSLSKTFKTNEFAFDVRWLMQEYSSGYFVPFVLAGLAFNSTSGTANEISFQDVYSQKDLILMAGVGAIIPVDEKVGFRIEGRLGADKQKCSGNYVAAPGVPLSFSSYSYSATAMYSRITAEMYYNISEEWNTQVGVRRGSYSAGIGPAYNNTALYASVGYAFR
jgi:hypothetical protein